MPTLVNIVWYCYVNNWQTRIYNLEDIHSFTFMSSHKIILVEYVDSVSCRVVVDCELRFVL